VHRFAATIETWWPAIEVAILTGYSNARSEGYNRLAKHQGRNASAIATSTTSAAPHAGPVLVNTDEHQQHSPSCPPKFDEPAKVALKQGSVRSLTSAGG